MTESTQLSPLPPATPDIPADLPPHRLSVVVPLYNEEDNVVPLLERIHLALNPYPYPWEVVIVDDGSSDNTVPNLEKAALVYGPHVRVVALMRNFKQTAAMQAGLDAARGDVIVTMDGVAKVHYHAARLAAYVCSQAGATPFLPEGLTAPFRDGRP